MRQEWRIHAKTADFNGIGEKYGIDPVIARIIRNRDIIQPEEIEEYMNGGVEGLHSPFLLRDMDKASALVKEAIDGKEPIRIIGDYDIDGVNSIYILYCGLIRLGAQVDYVVPHRVLDGYGINERLIDDAHKEGKKMLITCDNGIAAYNQIEYAKKIGMKVVVTDHHGVPFEECEDGRREILPPADAVVDPARSDCTYPWKKICGAVVAMKLVQALFFLYGRPKNEILDFLEFAAIATVGDVVDLQGENRTIVRLGLDRIRNTANYGLAALIDINKLDKRHVTSYHIGFVIGPCLNAGGRLETAMLAVQLLLSKDRKEAEKMAGELLSLNEERKEMTRLGFEKAMEIVENTEIKNDMVLVIFLPECHESIVGIIAGRVREKYNKPVIVFAQGEGCLKGSGRSIEGYNMFEKLIQCKDLLEKFGGHPMAAGMSILPGNLEPLRRMLNENSGLTSESLVMKVWIDADMPLEYISPKLIRNLSVLEPFGKGNEKPVFAERRLRIRLLSHMGKEGQYTRMILEKENGCTMEAVMFSINPEVEDAYSKGQRINVLYYPSINEYNGNSRIQIVINGVMLCKA